MTDEQIELRASSRRCLDCHGTGRVRSRMIGFRQRCPRLGPVNRLHTPPKRYEFARCEACAGAGDTEGVECPWCGGDGITSRRVDPA